MILYHLSAFALVLTAVIFQQFVPTFTGLHDSRVLLLPLAFLCASVTVNTPIMLALAFVCGFLWDAQHALHPQPGNAEIYSAAVETLPFGYSIVLYGFMGFIIQGVQPLFRSGKWQFSVLVAGVAVYFYLTAEYLLINFIRGDFVFTHAILMKIFFTAFLTMLVSPLIYWILFRISNLCRYTIRYDGLRQRRRFSVD